MKFNFGLRLWILIFFLLITVIAINPKLDVSGVEIKSLGENAKEQGLIAGEVIKEVNGNIINNPIEFAEIINKDVKVNPATINIKTDKNDVSYQALGDLKFELNNLTIINSKIDKVNDGEILKEINGIKINSPSDFEKIRYDLLPSKKLTLKTDRKEYTFLVSSDPEIDVKSVSRTNIKMGLDLGGGTRVLLKPVGDRDVTSGDINNLIAILRNKLNVYGLGDFNLRPASSGGEKLILIEVAGIPKEDIEDFIAKQGKFEAKIGNDLVFSGSMEGRKDIATVCKDDGTCSGVRSCKTISPDQASCNFEFSIKLSKEAAQNFGKISRTLDVNPTGEGRKILNKNIEFYLDEKLIDSLTIDADLKGSETTDILITGPGYGANEQLALDDALKSMEKLQTVLITGTLPFKLDIMKIDSISPVFGKQFIKNAFFTGLIAMIGVLLVVFIRYKKWRVLLPIAITLVSEVTITLGIAAAIGWTMDIAAIAGLIAGIGTGVNDQIVITDEILKGAKEVYFSWKDRIKKAFFIILVDYAGIVAAMLPLWGAAAGLLRGFAVTTIICVSIGVFVTKPAFGVMLEKFLK